MPMRPGSEPGGRDQALPDPSQAMRFPLEPSCVRGARQGTWSSGCGRPQGPPWRVRRWSPAWLRAGACHPWRGAL